MPRAETALNEASILGDEVLAWAQLDYWVLIGGALDTHIKFESLSIEESGDGITRMRAKSLNPVIDIAEGKRCEVIWRGDVIFGGIIRTVTIDTDQLYDVLTLSIEADGWDALLARHLITETYTNETAGFILRDAITASGIDLDGVTEGVIDEGVELILVEADHVRVGDFIRDVAAAGGGVAFINPRKQIIFRPSSTDTSDIKIRDNRAEAVQYMSDIDNYRNRQIVRVTGTGGNVVTETRDDLPQQAARIADEGGSGIYEAFEAVSHPTSNVPGELSILGQTVGYVKLRTYARNAKRITVTMRDPAPRIGQLVFLEFSNLAITGTFLAMRKTWTDRANEFVFTIEFWESNFQQIALESLLRIVGAGKASVSISANIFPNSQAYVTPGSGFTFEVPTGITSVQFTCVGGSGGGSLTTTFINFSNNAAGGRGGNSGKAVTILATTPTTVFDIVVGAKGAKDFNTAGSGGASHVKLSGVTQCQGDGGGGGGPAFIESGFCQTGPTGSTGGGTGDAVSVGGGQQGGAGENVDPFQDTAQDGSDGYIEVRW